MKARAMSSGSPPGTCTRGDEGTRMFMIRGEEKEEWGWDDNDASSSIQEGTIESWRQVCAEMEPESL